MDHNPFALGDDTFYHAWRERKLADAAGSVEEIRVALRDTGRPDFGEVAAIREACRRFNLCLYQGPVDATKKDVVTLGERLGLRHLDDNLCADEDRITSLRVMDSGRHRGYIPYSDRPLQWHTDGYYNRPDQQVRAVILHCVQAADEGGENALLDVELLYIALRDRDPALIAALQDGEAMTIPANIERGRVIRPARSGPVFSLDPSSGDLHMRYTARKRSIQWRDDVDTRRAAAAIEEILAADSGHVLRVKMASGEGLVSNNVLHNRSGFAHQESHGRPRLLYRARYYQRVAPA